MASYTLDEMLDHDRDEWPLTERNLMIILKDHGITDRTEYTGEMFMSDVYLWLGY